MLRLLGIIVLMAIGFTSCTINKNLMFKTDREYEFDKPNYDSTNSEYRIAPNDFITVDVFTNAGSLLLETTTTSAERARLVVTSDFVYQVDTRGEVTLPVIGLQNLTGMTIVEAQLFLEKEYTVQYNNPFIVIRIINRRIMVFQGAGGEGVVVPLINPNISVIEAIVLAGGLAERGNASKIKIIRRVGEKQEVYRLDLSVIEGMKYADMPVQSGDIIYVEPTPDVAAEVLRDMQPVFQLITSVALIYLLITRN